MHATSRFSANSREQPNLAVACGFAALLVCGSITRFPLLDELPAFRASVFLSEIGCIAVGFLLLTRKGRTLELLVISFGLVLAKFAYGWAIAALQFQQPLSLVLQESRFGFAIGAVPICVAFLRESSERQLRATLVFFVIFLVSLDAAVYLTLAPTGVLELGSRTDNRFVCSVIVPASLIVSLLLIHRNKARTEVVSAVLSLTLVLHSILITTSRTETLLSLGLLGLVLALNFPWTRWLTYLAAAIAAMVAIALVFESQNAVAGRDYETSLELAAGALPFGYGPVQDTVLRSQLSIVQDIYASDYGVLLYAIRYGILGCLLGCALVAFWGYLMLSTRRITGFIFFAVPVLIYFLLVPILEYGGLIGAFLISTCIVAIRNSSAGNE